MKSIKADICIIGAGSGGLSIAAGASQMGAKVVLIEGHKMGGDCLNFGCVPSKALIAAGKAAHSMTQGADLGVSPVQAKVDYAKAKDHVASGRSGGCFMAMTKCLTSTFCPKPGTNTRPLLTFNNITLNNIWLNARKSSRI